MQRTKQTFGAKLNIKSEQSKKMSKNITTVVKDAQKRWWNTSEAERYLGCKELFLINLRASGQLHFYKVGGHVLYDITDLDKLVIKNKVV